MRDVKKAINNYKMLPKTAGRYDVSLSEVMELFRLSEEEDPGDQTAAIMNSVMFGFTIGYRAAKRDAKKSRRKK